MRRSALLLVLPALVAAGCAQPPPDPAAASQAVFEGLAGEQLPFTASDGAALDIWVFRPDTSATGERVPIIVNYSPYWGNLAAPAADGGDAYSLHLIERYVPRGYAVALVSVRGTGLSEGCFSIGGPREVDDADEVATFLAGQPWSNGNLAAVAKSYDGTSAQYLLARGNPALKTIVPVSPISDWYRYTFYAGVPYTDYVAFNSVYVDTVSARQTQDPQDATYQRTPTRFCQESADVQLAQYHTDVTGDYTPYWAARNYTAQLPDTLQASVFYVHGLQDWNVKPDHMVDWIDALRLRGVPVKMWLGQWGHDYPHRDDWNETMLRWLDHELKGIENGVLDEPRVQVQDNAGVWRHEDEWPPARAVLRTLYPSADGALGAEPGAGASLYGDAPSGLLANLPSAGAATFTTEPAQTAYRIVGAPTLEATVSATGPRATLAAALLVDDRIVDQGFLDLAHRDGLESSAPLVPGQAYRIQLAFYPQDILVPAGSTLTLHLASSAPPGANVNVTGMGAGAVVTVTHGEGTALRLPVVDAADVRVEERQPEDVGCWSC